MGVDNTSFLVFGWEVDYEDAVRFLIRNRVGSCRGIYAEDPETKEVYVHDDDNTEKTGNKYQCFCGVGECWKDGVIPPGVIMRAGSPWYDCDAESRTIVVGLELPEPCTLESMNAIPKETIAAAKAFVEQLAQEGREARQKKRARASKEDAEEEEEEGETKEVGEPTFLSIVHIW